MKRTIEKIEYDQIRVIRERDVWQSSRGRRHHYTMASLLVLVLKKAR